MQSAARAVGVTTKELTKMLEQGKLLSEDFLPKFARQLRKDIPLSAEALNSVNASFGRLLASVQLFGDKIAKGGFAEGIKNISDEFAKFLKMDASDSLAESIGTSLKKLSDIVVTVIRQLPAIAEGFSDLIDSLKPFEPILDAVVDNLDVLLGLFIANKAINFASGLGSITASAGTLSTAMRMITSDVKSFKGFLKGATLIVGAFFAAFEVGKMLKFVDDVEIKKLSLLRMQDAQGPLRSQQIWRVVERILSLVEILRHVLL